MSLRLFIDQCVPRSVSESLRDAGHAVELLRNHMPVNAKDPDVIASAQALDAVLVSLNGDFADIINYPPAKFGGIIALQVTSHPESLPALVIACSRILVNILSRNTMPGSYFLLKLIAFELKSS